MDIGQSFQSATDGFFAFLPNLLGFLIILLIGYIVAKIVSKLVATLLQKVGLDKHLHESDANTYVEKVLPGASPAKAIAAIVFWMIFIFFLVSAIGALQIAAVTGFMDQVLAYLPNVIVAIFIFVIAALLSGAVAGGVAKVMGDTPTGKIVATVVPALVMIIAGFMILEQLQIAPEIVRIAFGAVMFALALGLALAFGLGGRDAAKQLLEDGVRKGREQREQVKSDLESGKARSESHARDAEAKADDDDDGRGASTSTTGSTTTMSTGTGYDNR